MGENWRVAKTRLTISVDDVGLMLLSGVIFCARSNSIKSANNSSSDTIRMAALDPDEESRHDSGASEEGCSEAVRRGVNGEGGDGTNRQRDARSGVVLRHSIKVWFAKDGSSGRGRTQRLFKDSASEFLPPLAWERLRVL